MKYTQLKDKHQDKLTELNNKVGLFWAFNDKQFAEGKAKNPALKYASIGMGGYLPKENVAEWIKGMKKLDAWRKEEQRKIKAEEAILYELNNHECFYTGDIDDAFEVLKDSYTLKQVQEVYAKNRSKQSFA